MMHVLLQMILILLELREEVNGKLEVWRQALVAHDFHFCFSKIKTQYIELKLSRRDIHSN